MLASAESLPLIPTRGIASMAAQAAPVPAPLSAAAAPSARGTLDNLAALLTWLDTVSTLGLDGHDLGEIGLKSGTLTVEDQRNGQKSNFDRINLSLTRQAGGEVVLRISSDNPEHAWVLLAGVKPLGEGRRAVSIEARQIMMRDLLLALRIDDGKISADMPLSLSLRAELGRDGAPQTAAGKLWIGPGTIADQKDPDTRTRDRSGRGQSRMGRQPARVVGAVPDRVGRQPRHARGARRGARAGRRAVAHRAHGRLDRAGGARRG